MTYRDMAQFNEACQFHELELIDKDYFNGKVIGKGTENSEDDINEINVKVIKPDDIVKKQIKTVNMDELILQKEDIIKYTVKNFRLDLAKFSNNQLEEFINYHKGKTIIKEAKKELEKRK